MGRSLEDRVVVITGASSGIGRAAATRFADKGAAVVLAARRAGALEDVARECRASGAQALAVPTDVTDASAVDELARRAHDELGRIDVWVNNAAVSLFSRFEEAPPDEYERVIDTNLLGCVRGTRAALPYMREQGQGTIINVSSVYGKAGSPYISAYATSKFAMAGLSESLRMELLDDEDLHVSTILPASIDTPLFQSAANYTGRKVKPMRPVYDADVVAKAIVGCARRPVRERIVGGAGRVLRKQRLTTPRTFERVTARMVHSEHFEDAPSAPGPGNVNAPLADAGSVSGGWPSSPTPIRRKLLAGAAAGGIAVVLANRSLRNGAITASALPSGAVTSGAVLGGILPSGVGPSGVGPAAARMANPMRGPVSRGTNPVVRTIRDLGLAAWFGGSLMGVIGINRAARDLADPTERLQFADRAWDRWTVPGALAISAHLLGSAIAGWGNKSRVPAQKGMASQMALKGGLSAGALAATVSARAFRKHAMDATDGQSVPVRDGTTPADETPAAVATAQQRLRMAEYAVPALTGAVVALNAKMSEDQRPAATLRGAGARLLPKQ